jgi:hypothetical protein
MPRRLLVVATAPDPSDELLERLERAAGEDVEVAVVAPASDVSPIEWMANDEDAAREEADRRARAAAEAAALKGKVVTVRAGDPDPVAAVGDALEIFPADELVVVTRPKDAATWLERRAFEGDLERFGLPVTHVVDDDAAPPSDEDIRALVRGTFWLAFVVRHLVLALVLVAGVLIAVGLCLYYGVV